MTRLLLIPSLALTLLFAAAIGAIRARPYDDSGLRAFLSPPDNCSPPCFMGIRLGRMTTSQAVEWLDQHPWVDHVILSERFGATQRGYIGWEWNGQQPAWMSTDRLASLWVRGHVVQFVRVQTRIAFGDLWLLLHNPPLGAFRVEGDFVGTHPVIVSQAVYPDASLLAQITVPCPLRPADFWNEPVVIQFFDELMIPYNPYDLTGWFRRNVC
ncbi:MAG: hypothetical protein HZC41_06445 [Chloroflexi bacterium]|nr:hypothetical protein [Chloroflexota bacterium]